MFTILVFLEVCRERFFHFFNDRFCDCALFVFIDYLQVLTIVVHFLDNDWNEIHEERFHLGHFHEDRSQRIDYFCVMVRVLYEYSESADDFSVAIFSSHYA